MEQAAQQTQRVPRVGTLLFRKMEANFRPAYPAAANYTVTEVSAHSCVLRLDCFCRFLGSLPLFRKTRFRRYVCIRFAPHHRETGTSLLTSVLDPYKAHAAVRYWSLPSSAYATVDKPEGRKLPSRPRPMLHLDAGVQRDQSRTNQLRVALTT